MLLCCGHNTQELLWHLHYLWIQGAVKCWELPLKAAISFVAAPCCTAPLPKNQTVLTSALQKLLMQFPHLQRDYIFCWTCMRHAGQLSSHVPQVGRILSMHMLQQKSATILWPAIHYFLPHTARDENQGITAQIITLCTGGYGTTQWSSREEMTLSQGAKKVRWQDWK